MNSSQLEKLIKGPRAITMGICNVTPDSFSDGGKFLSADKAIKHCKELFQAGSDIVDIGGESTGPGSAPVSEEKELSRIIQVVESASRLGLVSVDTYKAAVASRAIEKGATIINDVSTLRADPEMADVVKETGAWLILMHNKSELVLPHVRETSEMNGDIIEQVTLSLSKGLEKALAAGIRSNRIILDPGMGAFISNNPEHSWELLRGFEQITEKFQEFPVMVATSRKGFLGGKLPERDPVSQYTASWAVDKGAKIIRTHRPDLSSSFIAAREKLAASA